MANVKPTSMRLAGLIFAAVFAGTVSIGCAAPGTAAQEVYATPEEARAAGPDFDIQGEYEGRMGGADGRKIGVQVIALGGGQFQAVFLAGGLPGAGWDEKSKILCQGQAEGGKAVFTPAEGQREYMAGDPGAFSATRQFPPEGQQSYTAVIAEGKLTGRTADGQAIEASKIERRSPTLGAEPPSSATVLLAYRPGQPPSLEAWTNSKWEAKPDGSVQVVRRGGQNQTKDTFGGAWTLHVEFRSPFQPRARGQGRGNSGVFPPGGREVQVLDSFGLEGLPNECGGIYKTVSPRLNMCFPPLSWQTYDITYHPGEAGQGAWYQIRHNGVVIHEKLNLGRSRSGVLSLQDHSNPVAYRNIWILTNKGPTQ